MALTLCRGWLSQGIRPVVAVLSAMPTDLAPEFEARGIDSIFVAISKTGYRRYLELVRSFFAIARKYEPNALLSMPLGWHAPIAIGARLGGVSRIAAHVGNYPNPATGRAFSKFRLLVQLGRPFTDRLICCSRYVQKGAVEHFGVRISETAVIYNGVPKGDFTARLSVPTRPAGFAEPFRIGMVARLEKHKDHVTLIRAAKILRNRGRNISVKIVGDGSQRNALQHLIDAEELSDTTMLLGTRSDVAAVLADLDLFVFSTTPDEGFGIALVEAMLMGVPIVASDVGACREVLNGGDLGLLVPARDALSLADAVEKVCASREEAEKRAFRAREHALRTYSADAMTDGYGDILGLPRRKSFECETKLSWKRRT
ncbi:MAG: glycosyltransferase [Proteobacteria bacterium]|nr:glycosyltransferase [Pseudomonadota bacterium]